MCYISELMMIPQQFKLSSYYYYLPPELIAQVPAKERTDSRLLVLKRRAKQIKHVQFRDVVNFLEPGDCLVVNDTRVMMARLLCRKTTGGRVELLVLGHDGPSFTAMFSAHRGLASGSTLVLLDRNGVETGERVQVMQHVADGVVRCQASSDTLSLMESYGHVPLPPYIRRDDTGMHEYDKERYQTIFALKDGSVAAPTAGLHFTKELVDVLEDKGVVIVKVTLHVGPATFRPIKTEDIRFHNIGEERFSIENRAAELINKTLEERRRVIAVGTTSVRALETAGISGRVKAGEGTTRLFIVPGYRFRIVKGLITNFHLPCSSLLVLVSAFAGREKVLAAYREAVRLKYRFFSYGDAMLIL